MSHASSGSLFRGMQEALVWLVLGLFYLVSLREYWIGACLLNGVLLMGSREVIAGCDEGGDGHDYSVVIPAYCVRRHRLRTYVQVLYPVPIRLH